MSSTVPAVGTRERILRAAVELFAAQGYDATSISQVIERAGVAKGGLYHHFGSKQQLLYESYGDLITRQLVDMRAILALDWSPARTLRALIIDLVETTAARSQQALVFFRELSKLEQTQEGELRRARREYHETVRHLIGHAQQQGRFRAVGSAETITLTIFGMINELPIWYRPDGPKSATQLGEELAEFVLAALEPLPNSLVSSDGGS
jgi:AcrR family transcriptional regulator